ncbi:MAG: helix-turn-helix domain-containing protein [Planctomycetota bacterium]|nr:helix-turn-helix domain-containing protein [Planctomycetota bacterium]MDA0920316.1 helix-turn-helix domain-containing protein [Planctomycetota bacterium]
MHTVKQVAEQLNVSIGAVYKAIKRGDLEHHRFGSTIRVTEEQLAEYLQETRVKAEPAPIQVREFRHL